MTRGAHLETGRVPLGGGRARPAVGFTLIEMLVVIAIMAMLAAIVVPSYRVAQWHHYRNSCAANLKSLGQALAIFRDEYGCYPPDATEYLWTEDAVQAYRDKYGTDPPGDHSLASPLGAAYDPDGNPIDTGVRGMGLYTLYYLGAYARQLPPRSLEPRLYDASGNLKPGVDPNQGLSQFDWFKGGGYITRLSTFHCRANDIALDKSLLAQRESDTQMGAPYFNRSDNPAAAQDEYRWGNYDAFYRRNFWNPGHYPQPGDDNRNLCQPYPPVDTVVTWCPFHRSSKPPAWPGEPAEVKPGDEDLVLFVDGSVRRVVATPDNRPFANVSADFGYPREPIM